MKSLVPSLLGFSLFLLPLKISGKVTILFAEIVGFLKNLSGSSGPTLVALLCAVSFFGALFIKLFPGIKRSSFLEDLFDVNWSWIVLRLLSAVFAVGFVTGWGPAFLFKNSVGETVFVDIGTNMFFIYLIASTGILLLTEYGLMEFVGTFLQKWTPKLFRIPGSATIDILASLFGAASVGLLITIDQFEKGRYSAKEACTIAAGFSIVSLPFCYVIARVARIDDHFLVWYGSTLFACIIAAIILPRISPIAKIESQGSSAENLPSASLKNAVLAANAKAESSPGLLRFFSLGGKRTVFTMVNIIPACLGLATIATWMVSSTEVFQVLAMPIGWGLQILNFPDAIAAAPGFITGFLDQFLPVVTAKGLDSVHARFVLAGFAVSQLIYLDEVGILIMRSRLPLRLMDLAAIFTLRTLIAFPILYGLSLVLF